MMMMSAGRAGPPSSLMAEQLARVFGTEEDPVNCAFYFKVGACRHGDLCSKKHNRPTASRTLLLSNMYPNPPEALAIGNDEPWDDDMYDRAQQHLESFYTEIVLVLADYGEIEEVVVVDNTVEYMIGNVYVKFYYEEDAERALLGLTGRFYFGKLINAEYSPVTDFREARCRAFHETRCGRGGACRFLHIKHIPTAIKRRVAREMYSEHPEYKKQTRKRSRSRGRSRRRGRTQVRAIRDQSEPRPRAIRDQSVRAIRDRDQSVAAEDSRQTRALRDRDQSVAGDPEAGRIMAIRDQSVAADGTEPRRAKADRTNRDASPAAEVGHSSRDQDAHREDLDDRNHRRRRRDRNGSPENQHPGVIE
eukprot:CAMPEP_0117512714 /NCGR_PEP_ID=MMETSP0784-20121206/29177_1 /TAXON_ID=39447 /ORGANISM="" /LENGTH=361 /DNA_ID=CAMNT_0005308449 /DNA_START=23 /DNA_END=1108 /DNA_ORIENTATION=-